MSRLVTAGIAVHFAVTMAGCANNSNVTPEPHDPAPQFHTNPSWIDESTVVFESAGIVAFGPGWARVDSNVAGVLALDVLTGELTCVFAGGKEPRASRNVGKFVCVSNDLSGQLVIGDLDSQSVVPETQVWTRRTDFGLDGTGSRVVWRGYSETLPVGAWGCELSTGELRFLAEGYRPTWNCVGDSIALVQRELVDVAKAHLVFYDFGAGHVDTLSTFEFGESCGDISFSPDGSEIAFFRLSLDADRQGIWILSLGDGAERQLNTGSGQGLSWGTRGIVYSRTCYDLEDDGCGVLWLIDPTDGHEEQLTSRLHPTTKTCGR